MKKLVFLMFALSSITLLFSQHLPLKIGNQWHYNQGLAPMYNHVSIAVDTVRFNNKKYFKIENWSTNGATLYSTSYDRMEWDSTYYRKYENSEEELLFNFQWPDGFIYSTTSIFDTTCVDMLLSHKYFNSIWNIYSDFFNIFFGTHCPHWQDTSWTLSSYTVAYSFGSINGFDGSLVGAKINGISYGTLYPLPVELLSFSSSVVDDDVTLNWTTATETNNSGFQIERLETKNERSEEWESIGFVNGNGTITEPRTYFYKDENLTTGKYQYRLKQIDFDGTFEYSNIVEAEILPPAKFSLEQNYPNPFNPTTSIQYSLASRQFVTLKIFNTLGQEVETLVNEYQEAGVHSKLYIVNSSTDGGLPSGVYYYQLNAGEFVQTRKMIILK
ncbi:MAG: T9SS type A sorting domain-containing protein [Ignavibacteriaceae bacterium]